MTESHKSTMASLRQALLLLLSTCVIPVSAKVTVNSGGGNIQVKVLKAPSTPKKKAAPKSWLCEADGTCSKAASCVDQHADCGVRASKGECETNGKFMLEQCKESCFVCGTNG